MECEDIRHALSARMDGEQPRPGWDDDVIDAHLAECEECQAWYTQALALNRRLTITPAEPADVPDFSGQILAAMDTELPAETGRRGLWRRRPTLNLSLSLSRIALGILAIGYVVWAIVILKSSTHIGSDGLALWSGSGAGSGAGSGVGDAAGSGAGDVASSVAGSGVGDAAAQGTAGAAAVTSEETQLYADAATLRCALACGLAWVAWRPRASAGLIPLCGALWAFSAGFAARDVVLGYADMRHIAGLGMLVATFAVLVWCWVSNYGVTVAAARGSLRSLRAKPTTTTVADAHDVQRVLRDASAEERWPREGI